MHHSSPLSVCLFICFYSWTADLDRVFRESGADLIDLKASGSPANSKSLPAEVLSELGSNCII